MWTIPRPYIGHIRQSHRASNIILGLRPSRLCMLDFVGSSRSTLRMIQISSRWYYSGSKPFKPVYHNDFFPTFFIFNNQYEVGEKNKYRSLNQPSGRYQAFVWVGPAGIRNQDDRPTVSVNKPSRRKRYRHPSFPLCPRRRSKPVARNALMISEA